VHDGIGECAGQAERNRRFARPAGTRDQEERTESDRVPVAAVAHHHRVRD